MFITTAQTITEEVTTTRTKVVHVSAAEVWPLITRELAMRNITCLKIKGSLNEFPTNDNNRIFSMELHKVKLLKRVKSLCFCRPNEFIVMEKPLDSIKTMVLLKEENVNDKTECYSMWFTEHNGMHWSLEIYVTCK